MIRLSNSSGSDYIVISTRHESIAVTKSELKTLCDMAKNFFEIKWPDDDCYDEAHLSLERNIDSVIADDNRERARDMAKELGQC